MADIAFKPIEKIGTIYAGGTLTQPKFMPSYYEWLASLSKVINESLYLSTASGTVYTVPENYFFFMTNVNMSCGRSIAGLSSTALRVTGFEDSEILTIKINGAGQDTTSQSWAIPFKMPPLGTITVTNSNNTHCTVNIQGFLVPINLLKL